MLTFLLHRPIAVFMSSFALLIFSVLALWQLPISLLPSIEVPQIVIKVTAPNRSPEVIEESILQPVRERMATLQNLENIESEAQSESGTIKLFFSFNTDMSLAYIEINEKIDYLTEVLPLDVPRPQVIKINTNDIPIARLQIVPKQPNENLVALSELAEKVLKKRLEALEGIALIDLNGLQRKAISVQPKLDKMQALGISENKLRQAIRQSNQVLGAISVKDGQYRYFLKLAVTLRTVEDVAHLPIVLENNQVVPLKVLAEVQAATTKNFTWHLFNGEAGILVTLHKQADAQMNTLMREIERNITQLEQEFPTLSFVLTQNQSDLLNASIGNLQSSLLYGGLFAFVVLFLFLGNYRIPLIIGISLPTSLLLSFLWFYITGLSINIISLSGMALGTGMLIDNAIIVLDNITRKWQKYRMEQKTNALFIACVQGTEEMMTPLISSVLTTLAVFVPLVFLNGLSGALFYDQAIAIAATLGSSLAVSFVLLPLCYLLLFKAKKRSRTTDETQKIPMKESRFFLLLVSGYQGVHHFIFKFKYFAFIILLVLCSSCIGLFQYIKKQNLPDIEKRELVLQLDWNEPIEVAESKQRVMQLIQEFKQKILLSESDIGLKQLLIQSQGASVTAAEIYFLCTDEPTKVQLQIQLNFYLSQKYPQATFSLTDAQNAFNQIFDVEQPYLEARFINLTQQKPLPKEKIESMLPSLPTSKLKLGNGWQESTEIHLEIHTDKIHTLGLKYENVLQKISGLFKDETITEIKDFGEVLPIQLQQSITDFDTQLRNTFLIHSTTDEEGNPLMVSYPLQNFVDYQYQSSYKSITANETGIYQSVSWEDETLKVDSLVAQLQYKAKQDQEFSISFVGDYFIQKENLSQMVFILSISILLLYFILASQFESLIQPIIILFTLPLGVSGSLFFLWIFNDSLNIMSAIGIVVMLGIMVNDAILKIDTMNRLWRKVPQRSVTQLKQVILEAGLIRLKPILMTSVTTILALSPIIFSSGLGADLQTPLALAVIGGIFIGTLTALFFVPLSFYFFEKLKI